MSYTLRLKGTKKLIIKHLFILARYRYSRFIGYKAAFIGPFIHFRGSCKSLFFGLSFVIRPFSPGGNLVKK